jgi:hypothetical protein
MTTVAARAFFKKTTLFATAFVLAVSTLTAAVPFILSEEAGAVAGYGYSNVNLNQSNWTPDRAAPSGGWNVDSANGRVILSINQTLSSSDAFRKTEGVGTTVPAGSTSLTGSFNIAPDWALKSNLRVGLWGVTDAPVSWPIVEYAANVGGYTGWRIWNTVDGGWTNVIAPTTNLGGSNTVEILLNNVQNKFYFYVNNSLVGSFGANGAQSFTNVILNSYNVGTNNSVDNYVVDWRNLKSGVAPKTVACDPTIVWSNNLTQWNGPSSDTRAKGHNEITASGIRVYTEDASSLSKATGYRVVNYPLSANGSQAIAQSIDWTQQTGTQAPGLQLVVDFDNDGSTDGILVGEVAYGNSWWLTNGSKQFVKDNAPRTGGGNGSNWFGSVNEWLTSFPAAQVKEVGYSLGSGVYAGGVLGSMTFGCNTYQFDGVAPDVTIDTVEDDDTTITGTASDDAEKVLVTFGSNPETSVSVTSSRWSYNVPQGLDEGDYSISVVAVDRATNRTLTPRTETLTISASDGEDGDEEGTNNGGNNNAGNPNTGTPTDSTPQPTGQIPIPVTLPTTINPTTFAGVLGNNTANNSNTSDNADEGVEGASTRNNVAAAGSADSEANRGTFMGLGWYWWLLILAALALVAWWIIGAIRRRQAES